MQQIAKSIHTRKYFEKSPDVSVDLIKDRQSTKSSELNEQTNRMVIKTTFVESNRKERYKSLKVSDFALENQLAIGATLHPCKLSSNKFANIAAMTSAIDSIDKSVNSQSE